MGKSVVFKILKQHRSPQAAASWKIKSVRVIDPPGGNGQVQVSYLIHSLLPGVATPGGGWPELQLGCRDFFYRGAFTSFHTHFSRHAFYFCSCVLFHSCCSYARVFGRTLVHEFLISYCHTEQCLFFFEVKQSLLWPKLHLSKTIKT